MGAEICGTDLRFFVRVAARSQAVQQYLPLVEGAAGRGKTKRIPKEPGRATFAQAMLLVAVLTGFPGSARALVAHPETGCC